MSQTGAHFYYIFLWHNNDGPNLWRTCNF